MNISQAFLSEIGIIAKRDVPYNVMTRARWSLLDYLAVTCAGAHFQQKKLEDYFEFAQPETGTFKAIGTGKDLALKEAVFLNGLNGHALDFDDGTNSGIIHLGSPIFSLLIPLAQRYQITVDDMLRAAVIGYEASYTMAVSIQPKHKALGFHATGTCGMFGATLAAAYMLGFSDEDRFEAFAAACVAASGFLKVLDEGSELKPYNVAKTALLSLTSLQMAKAGFKGCSDPLGGYRGYLRMMTGDERTKLKSTLLNGTYAIMKSYIKPYASCRYTHSPVEAAIHLHNKYGLLPEMIEKITVKTYNLAVAGHDHTYIQGAYSAKMSVPYGTAVALIYGKAGLQEFREDILEDATVKALTKKVEVLVDEELSSIFPDKQSAILTIEANGKKYSERVDFPKGEPENPLSENEFKIRYDALMAYGCVNKAASDAIYSRVNEQNLRVEELIEKL